jgi:outer membrane biosynthesis protein TonB
MLLVWLALLAPSEGRQLFEEKCLYCHSQTVIQSRRLRPSQWRGVVAKMQSRAPLLISRRDADGIVRYIVRELRLVPPRATPVAKATPEPEPEEPAEETPEPAPAPPPVATPAPTPPPAPVAEEDIEAETLAPQILEQRCSKCHTLFRVFTKLDAVSTAQATIERMRRKTGSGISAREADLLKRFVRSRAAH